MSAAKNANLSWGQRYMWLRYHQLPSHARHEAHIVIHLKISDGIPLAGVRSTLNYLVRRHESLRTTYHLDAGAEPQQRVNPPAAMPLVLATTEQDGTATPAETVERLSTTEFDLATEWPIRACVITTAGAPNRLVLVLNHLAFDAWSIDQLEREITVLGAGIAARRPATLEPIRHQPSDLVRYESSADAAAVKKRAMAYWRDELSNLPANLSGVACPGDEEPAAHSATLTSPAMLATSRRIAGRHQVWPYLVHLTVYNMVMAAYTGSGTVAHLSFAGNRDANPYADTMTCMFSPLLMRVECHDDPSFCQLLQRVAQRFELAQQHSYLPYDEFVELVSEESFRRGRALQVGSELNFINLAFRQCRARNTRFAWNPTPTAWAHSGTDIYFRLYEWQDAVVVVLNAVSAVMGAEAVERFLRGYEAVLLAHDEPSTDLRISEVARLLDFPTRPAAVDGRVLRTSDDLVDLDRAGAVLELHPAVRRAHVSTAAGDPTSLVAHVVADRPVTPAQLRTHFLGHMYDHRPVRCPDRFRIYDGAADPAHPESWDALPPVAEGDGRNTERAAATSDAEQALAAVVQQVNGLGEVNLSDSYPNAGGRVLRIPQVLTLLRDRGWDGVSVYQLASARPLRAVAGHLTRVA